jgi:DNA end-binding protein Ku
VAAPRAMWKGFLKLGSITCGIKLAGATTESSKIRFRTLNRKNRQPIKSEYRDDETDKTVERDEQVKGYELGDGEFLIIEPAEIEKLKKAGEHRLDIDGFVPEASVSSVYLEKPYYLYPADRISGEPFALIRDAIARKKVAALGRLVMQQRERSVLIEPRDDGMVLTLLRQANEVADEGKFFGGLKKQKIDAELLDIATMLIDRKRAHFDPSKFEDRYENALIEMLEAKKKGKKPPARAVPRPRENVVNLASLLKRSLQQDGGKEPAKQAGARRRKAA